MKRILLVLEDYNELLYIETLLKKVGFDTMSTQKTKGIFDVLMTFRPSVIVISEVIKDQNGLDVLTALKENKSDLLGMVLLNPGSRQPAGGAESFIPRPIHPLTMLRVLGEWVGMNEDRLIEKIEKLGLFKSEQEKESVRFFKGSREGNQSFRATGSGEITGGAFNPDDEKELKFFRQTPDQSGGRSKRFQNALKDLPPPKSEKIEKKNVIQEVKEFRARTNDTELVNIDKERKAFVDALYGTKKKVS